MSSCVAKVADARYISFVATLGSCKLRTQLCLGVCMKFVLASYTAQGYMFTTFSRYWDDHMVLQVYKTVKTTCMQLQDAW